MKLKPILFTILVCLSGSAVFSQVCDFYYLQNGKTIEITVNNKKGDAVGRNVYKVSNVQKSGTTTTGTIQSELFDKKDKSIAKGTNNMKCDNGSLLMDLRMFLSPEQAGQIKAEVTGAEAYLSYPATMKTGDNLPDGKFNATIQQDNGLKTVVDINITDRKVGDKESVTTPAGTWDCFKITYHSAIRIAIMGIGIPVKADITEWFAPGFGTVKTESSKGGTTVLTKFQ